MIKKIRNIITLAPMQLLKYFTPAILFTILFVSCTEKEVKEDIHQNNIESNNQFLLPQGYWLGKLTISESKAIPFNFEIIEDSIYFINADEKIGASISKSENIFRVEMPIFDSEFEFSINENELSGFWTNKAKGENYKINFSATKCDNSSQRFPISNQAQPSYFEGKWETIFSPNTENNYPALGVFSQDGNKLTGTFLTETGDYRYLQGNISSDTLFLSCFDGSHAFMFEGVLENDSIHGTFYSGNHFSENWIAKLNSDYELKDPFTLTEVVEGQNIEFNLPNLYGGHVGYPNPRYTGKVVIIQLLGSWCPNCMDETKFLSSLYDQYAEKGLEVIGIAFENPENLDKRVERVKSLKDHFNAKYEFLIGGEASKKEAEKLLPILNHVISFPTTIFIDRDGVVRKIHTGFYGPGTGSYYLEYINNVQAFVKSLLLEESSM